MGFYSEESICVTMMYFFQPNININNKLLLYYILCRKFKHLYNNHVPNQVLDIGKIQVVTRKL